MNNTKWTWQVIFMYYSLMYIYVYIKRKRDYEFEKGNNMGQLEGGEQRVNNINTVHIYEIFKT